MPIDMPAHGCIRRSSFWLEPNTQVFESGLTRKTQTFELGGARWVTTITLRRMTRREAARWIAFFMKLKGRVNTFNAYDPDWKEPLGPAGGTPLVKGAGQTGGTLNIDGCTASVTGWMLAGDYFEVNGELKRLTQDANTNGSGEATLYFEPILRNSPADNAPLTIRNATCEMILADDRQAEWSSNENGIYEELTFNACEPF